MWTEAVVVDATARVVLFRRTMPLAKGMWARMVAFPDGMSKCSTLPSGGASHVSSLASQGLWQERK